MENSSGSRSEQGYIGLQAYPGDAIHLRNVRIKDLHASSPSIANGPATIQSDPNQPLLETLREDLLDEAAKKPKASADAYEIDGQLCDVMIAALDERDRTLAHAGFRAVEAQARTGVSSQALEARRNSAMSWPQFAREESQCAELKNQANNCAAVIAERPKLEWSQRTDQIRPTLDALYRQFRATLRQGEPAK